MDNPFSWIMVIVCYFFFMWVFRLLFLVSLIKIVEQIKNKSKETVKENKEGVPGGQ